MTLFSRLIQEEKQSTEARAEELESRVGSLEHMNLLARGRPQSPPLSGRSSPNSPNRDYLHKYHTVRDLEITIPHTKASILCLYIILLPK